MVVRADYMGRHWCVHLNSAGLEVRTNNYSGIDIWGGPFYLRHEIGSLRFRWPEIRMSSDFRLVVVPTWLAFVACTLLAARLVMVDRRRPLACGACQRCGYDLTGNISGRSPECGCATKSPPNARSWRHP
jgi:hypothetical protein